MGNLYSFCQASPRSDVCACKVRNYKKTRKSACFHWLNSKLLGNLLLLHFPTVPRRVWHTNAGTLIWGNIFETICSPLCLCCRATNLESTPMIHKFLNMNSGSCICFCDIYKHPKCHHVRVNIVKYWIVFISFISADGKIWTHICAKTTYNWHLVSA